MASLLGNVTTVPRKIITGRVRPSGNSIDISCGLRVSKCATQRNATHGTNTESMDWTGRRFLSFVVANGIASVRHPFFAAVPCRVAVRSGTHCVPCRVVHPPIAIGAVRASFVDALPRRSRTGHKQCGSFASRHTVEEGLVRCTPRGTPHCGGGSERLRTTLRYAITIAHHTAWNGMEWNRNAPNCIHPFSSLQPHRTEPNRRWI